jgi:hypothetical protein
MSAILSLCSNAIFLYSFDDTTNPIKGMKNKRTRLRYETIEITGKGSEPRVAKKVRGGRHDIGRTTKPRLVAEEPRWVYKG